MSVVIGAANRAQLSQSLPIVLQHRAHLLDRLEAQLAQIDAGSIGNSGTAAPALVEFLIDAARSIIESGELAQDPDVLALHDALGISGRHYSRFGDALIPTLKDISLPTAVATIWGDVFWSAIREASGIREAV